MDAHHDLLTSYGHDVRLLQADNADIQGRVAAGKAALGWLYSTKWKALVAAEIASFRPDIAHVHNTFPLLSPAVIHACKAAGVPVVQTLHNYRLLCPNGNLFRAGSVCEACCASIFPWRGVMHRCYHGSALGAAAVGAGSTLHRVFGTYNRDVDCFIALTQFAKRKFVDAGFPEHKFAVVPNWLGSDPGMGLGEGNFFLFVGRLSPEKGIKILLEAWSHVHGDARLKIVGTGPLEPEVVAAAGQCESIEFLGYQAPSSVLNVMQRATAVIIPSQCYEGLPLAMVESFATGTPVIAPRLGSLGELVADQRTGFLYAHDQPLDLARRIDFVTANPSRAAEMRTAARQEYQARYTAERAHELLFDVYSRNARVKTSSRELTLVAR